MNIAADAGRPDKETAGEILNMRRTVLELKRIRYGSAAASGTGTSYPRKGEEIGLFDISEKRA